MFCPRCGQQPATTAIRFCANCGLRLEGVTHLLTNDGHLPTQIVATPTAPTLKQRERRRGAKLLFSSFISFPFFCFVMRDPGASRSFSRSLYVIHRGNLLDEVCEIFLR